MDEKIKRVMDRVARGDYKVQEHFPQEVKTAVEAFFRATEMMINEELEYIPSEYLGNLLKALSKYPEYNSITLSLLQSMKKGEVI
mgnify:FL=1